MIYSLLRWSKYYPTLELKKNVSLKCNVHSGRITLHCLSSEGLLNISQGCWVYTKCHENWRRSASITQALWAMHCDWCNEEIHLRTAMEMTENKICIWLQIFTKGRLNYYSNALHQIAKLFPYNICCHSSNRRKIMEPKSYSLLSKEWEGAKVIMRWGYIEV